MADKILLADFPKLPLSGQQVVELVEDAHDWAHVSILGFFRPFCPFSGPWSGVEDPREPREERRLSDGPDCPSTLAIPSKTLPAGQGRPKCWFPQFLCKVFS